MESAKQKSLFKTFLAITFLIDNRRMTAYLSEKYFKYTVDTQGTGIPIFKNEKEHTLK